MHIRMVHTYIRGHQVPDLSHAPSLRRTRVHHRLRRGRRKLAGNIKTRLDLIDLVGFCTESAH